MENRMTRATEARSLSVPADMEPTSTDNTFDSSIGYVLRDTYRGFSRVLQSKIAPHGVSIGQWYFLRVLWEEDGLTQRELSQRVGMMEPTTVTALNGKRVEITNTDAEGRLILGDAMTFAERALGATHLVDVSTLTGIVYSAFGGEVAGTCGSDAALLDEFHLAARRVGEVYWPYPLADAYKKNMETWSADLQNSGTREASLVRSGLFLREFTTVPWIHLDIAGTAYRRSVAPFAGRGSTGAAHPSLVELAMGGGRRR